MAQPGGREPFGAPLGVAPQLQPLQGMLLRRSTDIYPKELARDIREFVESRSGAVKFRRSLSGDQPFRLLVPEELAVLSVSTPRSSNRTCGFPASGFRTR